MGISSTNMSIVIFPFSRLLNSVSNLRSRTDVCPTGAFSVAEAQPDSVESRKSRRALGSRTRGFIGCSNIAPALSGKAFGRRRNFRSVCRLCGKCLNNRGAAKTAATMGRAGHEISTRDVRLLQNHGRDRAVQVAHLRAERSRRPIQRDLFADIEGRARDLWRYGGGAGEG